MSKISEVAMPALKPAPPCACCGEPSQTQCWQFELCLRCLADWGQNAVPPPEAGEYPRRLADAEIWKLYEESAARWLRSAKSRRAA